MMTDIPDELISAAAVDAEHLTMLRALELNSYICVPMIAGGEVLVLLGPEVPERLGVGGQRQQQRDVVDQQSDRADQHDQYFRRLDDAHQLGLVALVGQLPRQGRQEEEGQDEQAAGDGAKRRLLRRILIDAVDHQHHHRGAEQIVVEGAEKLGDEDRQEAPGTE